MSRAGAGQPTVTQPAVSGEQAERPFLRVVRGDPTPQEVAALVAVLAASGAPAAPPRRVVRAWSARERGVRRTLPHGAGGWRASAMPH